MADHPNDVQSEIEALRRQLADMAAKLADLQRAAPAPAAPPTAPAAAAAPPATRKAPEELPEDVVLTIAAAVAAYLGERVRVRQVRLITSPAWAQQGRVSIQASHRLDR